MKNTAPYKELVRILEYKRSIRKSKLQDVVNADKALRLTSTELAAIENEIVEYEDMVALVEDSTND